MITIQTEKFLLLLPIGYHHPVVLTGAAASYRLYTPRVHFSVTRIARWWRTWKLTRRRQASCRSSKSPPLDTLDFGRGETVENKAPAKRLDAEPERSLTYFRSASPLRTGQEPVGFPSLCQGILLAKFLRRTIAEFDWIRWVIDRTEHSGGFFAAARLSCFPISAMRAHGAAVWLYVCLM